MSFTQPPSLIFIHSSKVFSQSFCQSAFPGKCHRAVAWQQCIIYLLTPIVSVSTTLYIQLIFLNSSLILTFLPQSVCFHMVLATPSLDSICLLPDLTTSLIKYVLLRFLSALKHTVIFILFPCNLMYMLNLTTFQIF